MKCREVGPGIDPSVVDLSVFPTQPWLDAPGVGFTTLAIAHRLSTLRKANRLVVVEAGEIVQVGTHEELFHREGTYARLVQAQLELAQQIGIG